ncbi:MAG: serine/threonine protein kinase [Myxococcaceae bacterium]
MSRYRLVGRLESGELAELYKAVRDDGVPVIIKLFHQKTSDAAYARHVAEMARALNPLKHDGIVHYLEVGTVQKRLAIVREFVDGYSMGQGLQRLATKEVLLPPSVALHVILELLEAVGRGHEAGCIHGAITPGNVVLSKEGRASVADFGALRALQESPALKAFVNKGRGSYRAPEVSRGEEVTIESDIYSLGAIAYELLTLRELNPGKGMSVRREAIPPPSRVDRRINSRLDPIVMRAVDLVPGRRFRSCNEMVTALRNFLSATGGMPGKDDVRKFVSELFPNEVKGDALGPVPFSEEFELAEVSGADFEQPDAERSAMLQPRPAFSGEHGFPDELPDKLPDDEHSEVSASRAETIQAAPAVEKFNPKAWESASPPKQEPNFDEGTSPGHAGPLEAGWDAPLGSSPKGPKLRPQGAVPQGATSAAQSPLKGRVRVVEDFAPLPSISQEMKDEDKIKAADAAYAKEKAQQQDEEKKRKAAPPPPVVTDPGQPKRLNSVERSLKSRDDRKQKLIMIAGTIAVVGLFCFGYAVWRFQQRPPPQDGPLRVVDASDLKTDDQKKTRLNLPPPVPDKNADDEEVHGRAETPIKVVPEQRVLKETPPKKQTSSADISFLTVSSNVAAYVYIDGVKLKGKTPIRKYPVAAGSRTIVLEALGTGERRKFTLNFVKGKPQTLIETFERSSGRR